MTVMAADRVGIVAHIGAAVRELGGAIAEFSQTVMRGFFTVIFLAHFPPGTAAESVRARVAGDGEDLAVSVRRGSPTPPPEPVGQRYILTVHGPDQPGLVAGIGAFLAGRDINIEDMYARRDDEGSGQFVMILQIRCGPERDTRQLQLDLAELADEYGVVAHLQHENVFLATNEVSAVRALSL